jgi:sirohydrochlorin cobaltochelatase
MTRTNILLVGHGSRRPAAVDEFNQFADDLSAAIAQPVQVCFLELAAPNMATGMSAAAQAVGDGGQVVVVPVFLGAANHEKNDVAAAIQWARQRFPSVTFRYGTPLGPHTRLVELLDLRVRQALTEAACDALPPEDSAIVVIGRGSSDPDSNSEVARLAHLLFEQRPYRLVTYAFQAVARPTMEEVLRQCRLLNAPQVVLVPYVLFTGRVYEDILAVGECGRAAGLRVVTATYLAPHPHLVEVAHQRLQEALEGQPAMTCDLCKYRLPMAGYEHQVGQVQHTHHLHGGSARQPAHPAGDAGPAGHACDHHGHDHQHGQVPRVRREYR